jgi:hypothetical protein
VVQFLYHHALSYVIILQEGYTFLRGRSTSQVEHVQSAQMCIILLLHVAHPHVHHSGCCADPPVAQFLAHNFFPSHSYSKIVDFVFTDPFFLKETSMTS